MTRLVFLFFNCLSLAVAASGSDGGRTVASALLESPNARTAALADAMTAAPNEIGAFASNPATLQTLRRPQMSLLYHRGFVDDSFFQATGGGRLGNWALGASAGLYDTGKVDVYDGARVRSVTAQRDLVGHLGVAVGLWGGSVGVAGKILRSEIAEADTASAFAADVGIAAPIGPHLRIGAAAQNIGKKMTYGEQGFDLPLIARAGLAVSVPVRRGEFAVLFDVPYFVHDRSYQPQAGLEIGCGPLSLRGGYRPNDDAESFIAGAGFDVRNFSIDYSFGIATELESRQRVSMSLRM